MGTTESFVKCPGCGKTLRNSAICVDCENERIDSDKDFQNLVRDLTAVIKTSRAHIKATIKESGFDVRELGLGPETPSFIKPRRKIKKKIHKKKKTHRKQ